MGYLLICAVFAAAAIVSAIKPNMMFKPKKNESDMDFSKRMKIVTIAGSIAAVGFLVKGLADILG